ncbi:hypothetical protein B0T17DRAFT_520597 [Bombardia bombarda]|uniref:Uncharacterized protein n=1 Tax=Bombardia bombarda TaxID=252184 RepID=A0AA40CG67_9PEZI|nr:hypothetical protein B0T17DRAFT_520597 [Bombardia bombarda]
MYVVFSGVFSGVLLGTVVAGHRSWTRIAPLDRLLGSDYILIPGLLFISVSWGSLICAGFRSRNLLRF